MPSLAYFYFLCAATVSAMLHETHVLLHQCPGLLCLWDGSYVCSRVQLKIIELQKERASLSILCLSHEVQTLTTPLHQT